jgi:tetratricopeptide (TPR) repeat protein
MVKGHAVWKYLALLTGIPSGRPVYDTPEFAFGLISVVANLAGLLVLPAVLLIAHRRRWDVVGLSAGWVLALLLPAILFPLVTYMADRYLYGPSLGFCWLLAAGIVAVSRRTQSIPVRVGVTALLTALPLTLFAYRTIEYNRAWAGSEPLWRYAIARSKDYRVRNNLAQALMNEKRFAEAERLYKQASGVENIVSHQGLAAVYYDTQRYPEAQREIERALEIAGKHGAAYTDLTDATMEDLAEIEYTAGAIYWVQGQNQRAIAAWEAALRANPRHQAAAQWLRTARGEPEPAK